MAIGHALQVSQRGRLAPSSPVRKLSPLAADARARGVTVLHINIGQPDIPAPQPILDAIHGYPSDIIPYAPSRGFPEALEAWSAYYRACGHSLSTDEVFVTTGGSEALWFAFMGVADVGDEILVFEPTYANYFGFACAASVRIRALALSPDDGFHLPQRSQIEAAITDRTRAICIATPNNPTGTVYTGDEMEMLLDIAIKHDLFVISDETYRELVFDGGTHVSMLHFDSREAHERVIIADSVSKRFSATGMRVGCLATRNVALMDAFGRFGQARLSTPTIEQLAVVPLLNDPVPYTTWLRGVYENRRNVVYEHLKTAGIVCQRPGGAFYVMVTLPVDNTDHFASWLLSDFQSNGQTVMIAPGDGFYLTAGAGVDQARIAYVLKEEDLARAIDILVEALDAYPRATA